MKTKFLIPLIILVTTSTYAGDNKSKNKGEKIRFGAEGGLNLANIIYFNQVLIRPDFILTWHAGAYACFNFNEKLSFQPELLYSVEGERFPNLYTVHSNYIELPLLLKYEIGKGFSIFVGPFVGVFIDGSSNLETTVSSNSKNSQQQTHPFDLGPVTGFEYEWENGLNIGLKYNQELCYLNEIILSGTIPSYGVVISLYAGWTFNKL